MRKGIRNSGFTLVELMVVIAVVGILAAGILVAIDVGGIFGKADLAKAKSFAESVQSGLFVNQVGKWSFEETSGTTAKDTSASGYGNDGTVIGAPNWLNSDQCDLGLGGCVEFNGTSNYINIENFPNAYDFNGSFTLSAWVNKISVSNGNRTIISNWRNASIDGVSNHGVFLEFVNGDIRIVYRNNGNDASPYFDLRQTSGISTGAWNHILATYNPSLPSANVKVYVNGYQLSGTENATGTFSITGRPLKIGSLSAADDNEASYGRYFDGKIDEVSIYDKALVASQIKSLYAQGVIRRAVAFGN